MAIENKTPYFRFFASDWLAGTRGMKADEAGVYITLISMMYERTEPVPFNDPDKLARMCGCSKSRFESIVSGLIDDGKVTLSDGGLWNKRVQKEFDWREKNSEAAKRAAKNRWKKDNENNDATMRSQSDRNADAMPNQKPEARSHNNTSSLRSEVSAPAKPTPRQELGKVLDDEHSQAVIDHRQRMRKPLTAHAAKLLAGKFSKWPDPNAAADAMISNGWQGFEPDWMGNRARGSPAAPAKSAFRQHQDEVTQSFRDALRGTEYDQSPSDTGGQPSFDLDERDFFSDRTASTGKR